MDTPAVVWRRPSEGTSLAIRTSEYTTEAIQYLKIYLDDHRAGATAGTDLARRLWRKNRSGPWGTELHAIRKLIQSEKETLDSVRAAVGISGGHAKRAFALLSARAARLKPNGDFLRYSALTRLVELEALMSGVQAKVGLWAALLETSSSFPELARFDFAALGEQSEAELRTLRDIHDWAARQCFLR